MTAATINKINAAIARHAIEVVKGNGYFFFADLEGAPTYNADKVASVYSNTLRCMSLEDWIAYVDQHLDMGNAELLDANGRESVWYGKDHHTGRCQKNGLSFA